MHGFITYGNQTIFTDKTERKKEQPKNYHKDFVSQKDYIVFLVAHLNHQSTQQKVHEERLLILS